MHKPTRLEILCVLVTATILIIMAVDQANRRAERREWASERAEDEAAALSRTGMPGDATGYLQGPDGAPASLAPDVAEQARRIPNPSKRPPATVASPAATAITAGPAVSVQGKASPAVSTNDIMRELERIATLPWTPASEQQLQSVVSKWAAADPLAALQYAQGIESRRVRSALLAGVFATWAKTDVNGAFSWMMANRESDPTTFSAGLRPVFSALAAASMDNAMRMALEISPGGDRMSALRIVVDQASRNGAAPALVSYLQSLQTPGERQNYASMLAQSWAVYDPQQAAQWAMTLNDPKLRNATMNSAVGVWAGDNPTAAAAWVLSLNDTELRSREIAQVTQSWARYDPIKAADWLLAQHPPSPTLDPAIQSLVGTVMKSNPEGAVMWAATISDPRVRNNTIVNASREWMRTDPARASSYIMNAPLTPVQKNRLLQGR